MSMIMSGKKAAKLIDVRLVDIHGTRFLDLAYAHDDAQDQQRRARIGVEDAYANPRPGDLISVGYLMNVVIGIEQRG